MPVKQVRLPGLSERNLSARWYQALIGPIQATGFAGGYDLAYAADGSKAIAHVHGLRRLREMDRHLWPAQACAYQAQGKQADWMR